MSEKINFDCLLPETRKLLELMIDASPFLHKYVFVGGSALALHLCHRKSEDLDFFTFCSDSFDRHEIRRYIGQFEQKEVLNESDNQIDILINGVKVTFFDARWEFLRPNTPHKFNLATIEAIAAMKVNVLFLRAKYRDYYDIYFLAKKIELRQIFELSKSTVEGLTYKLFCIALLYIEDIADDNINHLEPKEQISKKQIREFFERKLALQK